jgi:predicted transcriptional regulator
MPKDKSKVEKGLLKKGFLKEEGDHHYFEYCDLKGNITSIKTKTSHTKKMKVIPDNILSQMAKQCHLNKSEFLDLIDCPLSQKDYQKKLYQKGILSPDEDEDEDN